MACGFVAAFAWTFLFPVANAYAMFEEEMARELIKQYISQIRNFAYGSERLKESSNKASDVDSYYRDLCISGAKLETDDFDAKTGLPVTSSSDDDGKKKNKNYLGVVSGTKPKIGTCLAAIDTPKFTPPTDGDAVYSYFVNANEISHVSNGLDAAGENAEFTNSYRRYRNLYGSSTFPVGGALGCPVDLMENPPKTAADWKKIVGLCYDYYALQQAAHPE